MDYNFPPTTDRRSKATRLSLQEEEQALKLIEDRFRYLESKADEGFLETLIVTFPTYVTFTEGLWITEYPEKIIEPNKILLRLGKRDNSQENNKH